MGGRRYYLYLNPLFTLNYYFIGVNHLDFLTLMVH